jgi:pimeloyl-ACP methyl ester carboxylesterase
MHLSNGSFPFPDKTGTIWLGFTDITPPDPERVVLCVHGLTRQARDFDVLAQVLAADHHVIAFDLAGRGRSGWLSDKSAYRLDTYMRHVKALLHYRGLTEVVWFGSGIGGLIGMALAAEEDSPISHLILNDIGPEMAPEGVARIAAYASENPHFKRLAEVADYFRQIYAPFGPIEDAAWSELTIHAINREDTGGYSLHYDPAIGVAFEAEPYPRQMWSLYDRIWQPTLVVRGRDSDVLTPEIAAEMAERGPQADVVEIAGRGHLPPMLERCEIDIVARWLAQFVVEDDAESETTDTEIDAPEDQP